VIKPCGTTISGPWGRRCSRKRLVIERLRVARWRARGATPRRIVAAPDDCPWQRHAAALDAARLPTPIALAAHGDAMVPDALPGPGPGRSPGQPDADADPTAAIAAVLGDESIDLAWRWRAARRSALRAACPDPAAAGALDDEALLAEALASDAEAANKAAFEHSLRLGEGFRRVHRCDLPLHDLAAFLPLLGAPCVDRRFAAVPGEAAALGERAGCADGARDGRACAFWREAAEGLVLGMTSGVRLGRHRSRGAGDDRCVDALFVHPESPRRFGAIPEALRRRLEGVAAMVRALDSHSEVEFLGLSEGVLYYRTRRDVSEPSPFLLHRNIERGVARCRPDLKVRDVTPRPVITPGE
jgi:hypothetical protein